MATPSPIQSASQLPAEIAAALARGVMVVTANSRAARTLQLQFASERQAEGRGSWQAPAILDWQSFLRTLWAANATPHLPLLLTPMQEKLLWEQAQSSEAALVVAPERLAELSAGAYALLSEYRAQNERQSTWFAAAHEDAEHFISWAERFDEACEELDAQPPCETANLLAAHADSLFLNSPPPSILLVGFDRILPTQSHLLHTLGEHGVVIEFEAPASPAHNLTLVTATDEREELHACAHWLRSRLLQNPSQRIGVLTPNLQNLQPRIDRAFRRVLMPQSAASIGSASMPYEFSLGTPLANVPVIQSALLMLQWLLSPLQSAEVTLLLSAGFLATDASESNALATLDANLRERRLLPPRLALPALLRIGEERVNFVPQAFAERMRLAEATLREHIRERSGQPPSFWAEHFAQLLELCGWPGAPSQDSVSFQSREKWSRLLDEAALLGFNGARMSAASFLATIRIAAHNTSFAPESSGAPVQIMGISEAAGQRFDAIWFLRADENSWPGRGRPHPLLPQSLQVAYAMPHASHEHDRILAEEQTARVLRSSPVVLISTPLQVDGNPTRLSPLLRPSLAHAPHLPATAFIAATAKAEPTSLVAQQEAATVRPWPTEQIAGGTEVLKRQAACAFQSFAAKRLRARERDEEAWGFDAGERGGLLHEVLALLWSPEPSEDGTQLHTREDLLRARANNTLRPMLDAAIERASAKAARQARTDVWQQNYLAAEQERLRRRVLAWLELEATREDFYVGAIEHKFDNAPLGPLHLNLRADRMDIITNDAVLVLDYKSSAQVSLNSWDGERPDEPQLPIYALHSGVPNICGVAFGRIRPKQTSLLARSTDPETQLGKPWARAKNYLDETTLREWGAALKSLATQFAAGEASVNPKRGEQTCSLCGLMSLCRIRSTPESALANEDYEENNDA